MPTQLLKIVLRILSSINDHSELYDEKTFYKQLVNDLHCANREVIINSPFITNKRVNELIPELGKLVRKKISVYVVTRDPYEHNFEMQSQAEIAIRNLLLIGVRVKLFRGYEHRKVAIIDREILWEGSLNIFSQSRSHEMMRRIKSESLAKGAFKFMNLDKFIY